MGLLERVNDLLLDVVLRLNHDRAQRHIVGVGGAAIIHGHGVEAGERVRLAFGIDFLQMPAIRFFSLVDAANDLKAGYLARPLRVWCVRDHCIERLIAIPSLKCQVINSPPLQARKRFDFVNELRPIAVRQTTEIVRKPTKNLGQLKD